MSSTCAPLPRSIDDDVYKRRRAWVTALEECGVLVEETILEVTVVRYTRPVLFKYLQRWRTLRDAMASSPEVSKHIEIKSFLDGRVRGEITLSLTL